LILPVLYADVKD